MDDPGYSPLDPTVRRNPYPYYAALRRDAPVYEVPGMGLWAVARHADVMSVLKRPELFSSAAMAAAAQRPTHFAPAERQPDMPPADASSLIGSDPPLHTRLRSIVNRGFTPRRIAALETRIREIATGLAHRLSTRGECDLIADFAAPLPATVIAELLGMDASRHEDMKRWSDAIIRATFDSPRPEETPHISRCFTEMTAHFDEVIAERQARPTDDLISALVRAESVDGALTVDEMNIFIGTLLVAGNVTTTNLIALGTLALLGHPGDLAKVKGDLGLVPALVEETLRYDGPTQLLLRTATADVELSGVRIPAGALVAPLFASANRDERVFTEPDRFDVARSPREHLAFGYGAHFCLGAALARLEARVAFETLLPILGRPVLLTDELEWIESIALRGVRALPLRFEPRAVADRPPGNASAAESASRCPAAHGAADAEGADADEAVVRRFLAAWSRLDPRELAGYFSEDGTYHNVPMPPVRGRANIEETIRAFTASWTATDWEVRHVLAAKGIVMAERIDRTRAGDKRVELPIVGVFELEDGKIKVWRDYFDLGTYLQAMS
jgi:uncharacterized protein (TIGR02246 family)